MDDGLIGALLVSLAHLFIGSPLVAQDSFGSKGVPSAIVLRNEISDKGAREIVQRLNHSPNDENGWDGVIRKMSSGEIDYIALASDLAPGTDAGTSEDLGIALAYALPIAPAAVLAEIDLKGGRTLGVRRVCGVPFIEDSVKDLPGYVSAARLAVNNVSVSRIALSKAACLQELDAASRVIGSSR